MEGQWKDSRLFESLGHSTDHSAVEARRNTLNDTEASFSQYRSAAAAAALIPKLISGALPFG